MKKHPTNKLIVLYLLAVAVVSIALVFLCANGILWALEKDGNTFQDDAFGAAASKVFPDVSTPPAESEPELCYHKELMHESYCLTLQFDEKQAFALYCEAVEAGIAEQVETFVFYGMDFHHIPVPNPDGYQYTNFYIIFDSNRQSISYFFVDDEQYGFTSEEAVLEWCFQQGILSN